MANAATLNAGQLNGVGGTDALFLKVYGGEVLSAFEESCVTQGKFMERTITSGKSAQFPATWKVTGRTHIVGTEIVGQASNVAERVITIDGLIIADVFLPSIDEAKSHYDYRSVYSRQAGLALAYAMDKNLLQTAVLAARSSATVTGAFGGTTLTSATNLYKTSSVDLAAGIFAAVQAMDEKDIPDTDEKYVYLRPAQYYLLGQNTNMYNMDFAGANNGSYSDGKVFKVGGATLVKTNHLPNSNITTGTVTYQGDFSKTAALVCTKGAAGTVKLMDLAQEMQYDIRRQGTLIVSKYAVGHGILRPECAVELLTTS